MEKRLIAIMFILCSLVFFNNLKANEALAKPIYIHLYSHVIGQEYLSFLNDYSQYQLKFIINSCNDDFCNEKWFIFNRKIIEENDFLGLIRNDSRVSSARFNNGLSEPNWRPRTISLKLANDSEEADLINKYSEYKLRGSIPNHGDDRKEFTFDDTSIYSGCFLDLLKYDIKVSAADIVYGWRFGYIAFRTKDWVIDEIMEIFLKDYSHYDMSIISQTPSIYGYDWVISIDPILHDEFYLLKELLNDERVSYATFDFLDTQLICFGPVASNYDETWVSLNSVSVTPNPALNDNVTFAISSPSGNLDKRDIGNSEIVIYNVRGQKIMKSKDFIHENDKMTFIWDRKNIYGQTVSSGFYLYRIIHSNEMIYTGKILILK
ncbi:MAG: T9SS type A sorting domain-containing protein [Candidatus Cloacimonetes bacterium]|nr:T9SS type A sorting domain-containing protein [Candidatus Cloacimonadota bacterium]